MKLSDALKLIRQPPLGDAGAYVYLACGMTPLHLATFLGAHLINRSGQLVRIDSGRYGDLVGNIDRGSDQEGVALAVVIEWADLDARLGLRSSFGWRAESLPDIFRTVSARLDQIYSAIELAQKRITVVVATPTLPLPPCFNSALCWGEASALALQQKVYQFASATAAMPMVRVVSPTRLDQRSPPATRLDVASELRAGFPYQLGHASVLAEILSYLIYPAMPKKGVITDLDNTLWRGILGDDGVNGVTWDLDHQSHSHAIYQGMLASLANLGVLVGVASKNDPGLVKQVLARDDLIVPADTLFPVEVHWGRKSESVHNILKAWNIGADSVVFIDDSELEIAEVSRAFPNIHCIRFPTGNDNSVYDLIEQLRDLFGKPTATAEDRLRVSSLRLSYQREYVSEGTTPDELLRQANAEITAEFDRPDARAFELINKTNQFNLNGNRIDESTWKMRQRDLNRFVLSILYTDKFGPLGKIAVVCGRCRDGRIIVDTWVMSCRAFSRRIEYYTIKGLFDRFGLDQLLLDFSATGRNGPFREFLQSVTGVSPQSPTLISRATFEDRCPPLFAQVKAI